MLNVSMEACQSGSPSESQRTLSDKVMTDKKQIEALYREMYEAMIVKDIVTLKHGNWFFTSAPQLHIR